MDAFIEHELNEFLIVLGFGIVAVTYFKVIELWFKSKGWK